LGSQRRLQPEAFARNPQPVPGGPRRIGTDHDAELAAGDVLRFERSGGGGYGPPQERSRDEVLDDVRNGYISAQSAKMIYGRTFDAADLCSQDHDEHQMSNDESETPTVKVLG
jgi:N-methylhydantoinase B/oxoprolinase/acetone carboxylase alpha subunit